MAQNPPPPPSQPAGATPSSVGSNKKTYTILAYVLTWVGGLIFLFVGKDDPDVKWNSANSLIIFGGLPTINIILRFIPGLSVVTFPLLLLPGRACCIFSLVRSLQGN